MTQRKRLQPELRKQQIVEAAIALFFEVGYEGASLRDLAARVGINKATIYHYFESKEEILFQILRRVGRELHDGVRDAASAPGSPLAVLEGMIRFQIGYMEHHVDEVKVLVEEKKSLRDELQRISKSAESGILELYKRVIERCLDEGLVRDIHPTTAAFGILGQINWLYHWYQPDGPMGISDLADQVVLLVFHGMLPDPEGCR